MSKYEIISECYSNNLSNKAKTVLNYFIYRCDKKYSCFPAIKTIAKECSISTSTVQRAIRELMTKGIISKSCRYRENGSQTSNLYGIIINAKEKVNQITKNLRQLLQDAQKVAAAKAEANKQLKMHLLDGSKNIDIAAIVAELNIASRRTFNLSDLTRGGSQYDYPKTITV